MKIAISLFFILTILMVATVSSAEYKQPTIEEIRARQAANNPPDPFRKVEVEFIIPEGMAVFTDPVSNCQYFVTVDEKGRVISMTKRGKNSTEQMCQ